jgi:HEAT repeats
MSLRAVDLDTLLRGARAELAATTDDAVPHLVELHRRGTREVFTCAVTACASAAPDERLLGVMILRELGGPSRPFSDDAVPVLLGLLAAESSPRVVRWTISALGYQQPSSRSRAALDAVPACARHPDALVRFAVAAALPSLVDVARPDDDAVRVLIELAGDADAETRYYALAALTDDLELAARAEVRAALEPRRSDEDAQIRRAAARVLAGGTWAE